MLRTALGPAISAYLETASCAPGSASRAAADAHWRRRWPGRGSEPRLDRVDAFAHAGEVAALIVFSTRRRRSSATRESSSQTVTVAVMQASPTRSVPSSCRAASASSTLLAASESSDRKHDLRMPFTPPGQRPATVHRPATSAPRGGFRRRSKSGIDGGMRTGTYSRPAPQASMMLDHSCIMCRRCTSYSALL
jgi:hypothetical protein